MYGDSGKSSVAKIILTAACKMSSNDIVFAC